MSATLFLTGVALLVWVVHDYGLFDRRGRFPGPTPYPVIGNSVASHRVWEQFNELGRKFGPIFAIRVFRKRVIVINSGAVARELFDKKGGKYWLRSPPKMVEMAGMKRGVLFEPDYTRMKQGRNMLHLVLHPRELDHFRPSLEDHVVIYLNRLAQSPHDLLSHIRALPTGVLLEISHGYVAKPHDPFVQMSEQSVNNFIKGATIGAYAVEVLPFLAWLPHWLPGMSFKRQALRWRDLYVHLSEWSLALAKDDAIKGTARPSFVNRAIEAPEKYPQDVIIHTATQIYSGGAHSTVSTISFFFIKMMLYPDVQCKAQEEIDRVIGPNRMPTFDDKDDLPYTYAVLLETIRTCPPLPLLFRESVEDDEHEGLFIPRGTAVAVNIWAVLHDPSVYPDPHAFKPERWLAGDMPSGASPLDVAFGYGRRICPGRLLAEQIAFTAIASVLALFDVRKPKDADGTEISPRDEMVAENVPITGPYPFQCDLQLRSESARSLLKTLSSQSRSASETGPPSGGREGEEGVPFSRARDGDDIAMHGR